MSYKCDHQRIHPTGNDIVNIYCECSSMRNFITLINNLISEINQIKIEYELDFILILKIRHITTKFVSSAPKFVREGDIQHIGDFISHHII